MSHPADDVFRRLVFVGPFDELQAFEARARGYLSHVLVETVAGQLYPVMFYDPVRLQQDLDDMASAGEAYIADPGMIVVPEVTIALMEAAARGLCAQHFFAHLRPVTQEQLASADRYGWPPRSTE